MNDMSRIAAPVAVEAEQQLLGALLGNNALVPKVAAIISAEHFADATHSDIFRQIVARVNTSHVASPVTLSVAMSAHPGLKELGGSSYLVRLAGAAISSFAAPDYARLVVDAWSRRTAIEAMRKGAEALSSGDDLSQAVAGVVQSLYALPREAAKEPTMSLVRATTMALEQANEAYQGRGDMLATGIGSLDRIIHGMAPGDFMVLGGATSMGKTSVALHMAQNVATAGKHVAFVSLEMSPEQLANRLISAQTRIAYTAIRSAETMEEDDFRKWIEGGRGVSSLPITIIPRHVRDVAGIHAACRMAATSAPLSLIVVDYAQLVRAEGKGIYEQMTAVSIGLKTMAGLMGVPVIGLVQLKREIEQRDNKRPQLTDIKESGQFENDADQVVFAHREGYWLERQGPKANQRGVITDEARADWEAEKARHANRMELIVRKNRHGRIGIAEVGFHEATNRFWTLGDA